MENDITQGNASLSTVPFSTVQLRNVPPAKSVIRMIGTSHIAKDSARKIRQTFDEFQPDIIAIELDKGRLQALLDQKNGKKSERMPLSMIKQVGMTGYLFALIGRTVQKRLGNIVDVTPGVDMLAAVELAREHQKKLALVDQDIVITMRHLSSQFTSRQKMRLLWDIISAPFSKKKLKMRLDVVPDDKVIEELMEELRKRYPGIYNALIVERNIYMAAKLDGIVRTNPGKKILLVIGAGHGKDLKSRMDAIADII